MVLMVQGLPQGLISPDQGIAGPFEEEAHSSMLP
jgi:hypothetical protein